MLSSRSGSCCYSSPSGHPLIQFALTGLVIAVALAGCARPPVPPSNQHMTREALPAERVIADIPAPVMSAPLPPPPIPSQRLETFSVVVNEVPVRDLLFALARDAKMNVDVHPAIYGSVTVNALNQTLPQLLTRIARQVDLRWEINGGTLSVLPDSAFLSTYTIDYVNMARSAASNVNVATQIGAGGSGGSGSGGGNNNSSTVLTSNSVNYFWESLAQNICNIVVSTRSLSREQRAEAQQSRDREQESRLNVARQLASAGSGAPQLMQQVTGSATNAPATGAAVNCAQTGYSLASGTGQAAAPAGASNPVISNRESGIIMVYATQRQHEKVREFVDRVVASARRQVLIEATVVEVQLGSQYQQGINWQFLRSGGGASRLGFTQQPGGPNATLLGGSAQGTAALAAPNALTPGLTNPGGTNPGILQVSYLAGNLATALNLLESFGNVRVLSSPKLSVLNNQTAMLKVVDNRVYFTVTATVVPSTVVGVAPTVAYNTSPNTVPVGFVMAVTPQIDDVDQVTINVRPSISRILRFVNDPNPQLAAAGVQNRIPEIQTREMESILKVPNNEIAVMGGLMQDDVNNGEDGIPGLSRIPLAGELFRYRNETANKSELVIFLRPIVIRDPSLDGDYRKFRDLLPGQNFLSQPNPMKPATMQMDGGTTDKPTSRLDQKR